MHVERQSPDKLCASLLVICFSYLRFEKEYLGSEKGFLNPLDWMLLGCTLGLIFKTNFPFISNYYVSL